MFFRSESKVDIIQGWGWMLELACRNKLLSNLASYTFTVCRLSKFRNRTKSEM